MGEGRVKAMNEKESFPWDNFFWDNPEALIKKIYELESENFKLSLEVKRLNEIAHKRLKANNTTFAWGCFCGVLWALCFVLSLLQNYGVRP
jgi:hypothetical protein